MGSSGVTGDQSPAGMGPRNGPQAPPVVLQTQEDSTRVIRSSRSGRRAGERPRVEECAVRVLSQFLARTNRPSQSSYSRIFKRRAVSDIRSIVSREFDVLSAGPQELDRREVQTVQGTDGDRERLERSEDADSTAPRNSTSRGGVVLAAAHLPEERLPGVLGVAQDAGSMSSGPSIRPWSTAITLAPGGLLPR